MNLKLKFLLIQKYILSLIQLFSGNNHFFAGISGEKVCDRIKRVKRNDSHPNVEDSSDKIIPEDVSLPSHFLLPNIDDSSSDQEAEVTELKTEAEINVTNNEEEMPSINLKASSLVNTHEFLEFMDTIEMDEAENTKQSEITEISEQTGISEVENPTEQTNVDPKSESQFSSFMSFHEGESSSMDPSTGENGVKQISRKGKY